MMGKKKGSKTLKKAKNKNGSASKIENLRPVTLELEPSPQIATTLQRSMQGNISSEILSHCLDELLTESKSILSEVSSQSKPFVLSDQGYFYFFRFIRNLNYLFDLKSQLLAFRPKYIEILKVILSSLQQVESKCLFNEGQCIRVNRLLEIDTYLRINNFILDTGKRIALFTYEGDVDQCEKITFDLLKRIAKLCAEEKPYWEVIIYSHLVNIAVYKNQERNIRIYSGLAERALSRYSKCRDKSITLNHHAPFVSLYSAYNKISDFYARINCFEEAAEWLEDSIAIGKKGIEVIELQVSKMVIREEAKNQRLEAIKFFQRKSQEASRTEETYKDKARKQKIANIQEKLHSIFVENEIKINQETSMVRLQFSHPFVRTMITNIFKKRKMRFADEAGCIVFNLDLIRKATLDSLLEQIISEYKNLDKSETNNADKSEVPKQKALDDRETFGEVSTDQQKEKQLARHLANEKARELEKSLGKLPEENEKVYGPLPQLNREIRWDNPEFKNIDPENDKETYFRIYGRPGNATYLMFSPKLTFTDGSLEDKAKSVARSGKFLTSKLSKGRQGIVHYKPEKQAEKIRKLDGYSWKIKMRSFEARPVGKTVAIGTVYVDGKASNERVEMVEVDQVVRKTHKQ